MDIERAVKIIPKGNVRFAVGLGWAEEGASALAASVIFRAAAAVALGDPAADTAFRTVGANRNSRTVEHQQ
ncbi:MAG: hypothetical protein ACREFP_04930, partial [Acetobacteraceae bacterium]